MIKNIIILTVFALAIFLLNRYYQQSSLNFKDGMITLEVKGKRVKFNSTSVKEEYKHFSNVEVLQKELMLESRKSYYEEAHINGLYEFNHNIKEIINILFKAKKIENIFSINALHAMQIITEDDVVINLFITDSDNKEFHLFYGIPTKLFRSAILTLIGKDKLEVKLENTIELKEIKTEWSIVNNDINGLISSIDY
jgi:hypothetical protein